MKLKIIAPHLAIATWILCLAPLVSRVSFAAPVRGENLPRDEFKVHISQWTLPNGMSVVYSAHRRVPAVTVQVWYHVGSKNEHPGIRGIAHLFEHMMFKGSEHVPPEEHAEMISAVGGSSNAFTAEDVTAYHDTVPSQYLEFAMQLEAERMRFLHLTEATIRSEREVVKEEKRAHLENSPIGRAVEAMYALAFEQHPYAWTPAGVMADLVKISMKECAQFYSTFYSPQNATLIVVGDVEESRVRQAAMKYFGGISKGKVVKAAIKQEPPQTSLRRQKANWKSQLKIVLGAYHIPEANNPDIPALTVLSTILSVGRSSRLNQVLVRKNKLAVAAGGFVRSLEDPGLMVIYGAGLPNHDLGKITEELLNQIELLASAKVTPDELIKAKNQLTTSKLRSMQTLDGLANEIGRSLLIEGDVHAFQKELKLLDAVTAEDIQRVAKKYLRRDNLSLIVLDNVGH